MSTHQKGGGVRKGVAPRVRAAGAGLSAPRVSAPAKPPALTPWSQAQWGAALAPILSEVGEQADEPIVQALSAYMVLLSHWNSTYNLTALRDPQDMLTHHLSDCLAVLGPLKTHLAGRPSKSPSSPGPEVRVLDVGSGGGLPGVVLAICLPNLQVTCVDTVGKKAAFIRQVAAELHLPNLRAEHARVEQLRGHHDLITSRAFASLNDFVALTRTLLADGGVWMAMKGKQPEDELSQLPPDIDVFHVEQLNVPGLDAQRCLVWMRPR